MRLPGLKALLRPAMQALQDLMDRTKTVHITGPGSDLRFSIEGTTSE